jgi:hypothetical protein
VTAGSDFAAKARESKAAMLPIPEMDRGWKTAIHFAMVETKRSVAVDELRDALHDEPRVALIRSGDGLVALNTVIELMRDLDRPRGDM